MFNFQNFMPPMRTAKVFSLHSLELNCNKFACVFSMFIYTLGKNLATKTIRIFPK